MPFSGVACKRVFILGFDGAGAAPEQLKVPGIRRVFSQGAFTWKAQTAFPTISAECWGTMLHSVEPEQHRLTNDIVSREPYPEDSPYPSIFRLLREQRPEARMASFAEWAPINVGIIESNLGVDMATAHGDKLGRMISDYLRENDPTLLFMQLDGPDEGGHTHGYFTQGHYDAIEESDAVLGMVLDAIQREGMWEDSLILLTTDHGGGGGNPRSHGADHPLDKTIYWGCCGPMIARGRALSGPVYVADTAAVAAMALGLRTPDCWIGKIPEGLLQEQDA